jgi:hypothetical protein
VDCNSARMLVAFFGRQGSELAPEDAAELNAHLAGCSTCAATVQFERAFDDRVGKAMLAVPVPANLKAKLLDGVAAARGAWYRQKFYAVAGLAAAIVVAVGGMIAYQIEKAPELRINELIANADADTQRPEVQVERILSANGLRYSPEKPFELRQLLSAEMKAPPGQSRQVPSFILYNAPKNAQATVYVVRDTDYNWKSLPQDGSSVTSTFGFQLAVVRDTRRSDVAYIVVFTGAGLELFLEDRSTA